ncbi:MAG: GNAT family N-acetyltransferase, partial [Candidatus Heimdallarchaeota archaeon]
CKDFFCQFIPNEEFLSWIAEDEDEIIATSGLVFLQKPPDPRNLRGKEAYIMNMYTLPEWRNQGIATKLMEEIFKFIKKRGINLIRLHTTEGARSTYEKMGFIDVDNEMEIRRGFSP